MVKESRQHGDRALAFLVGLAGEFTVVLAPQDLVDRTLALLQKEAGFESAAIAIVDDQNPDRLTVVGATGLQADLRGRTLPKGGGLQWAAIASAEPLYVRDLNADPRTRHRDDRVRSGIYVPLTAKGDPIGVLSAQRRDVDAFAPEDVAALAAIGRYLEGAFEVSRLHARLRDQATTDTLTGLADRRRFLTRLEAELARTRRGGRVVTVALLDLDGFKAVNDSHGHAVGDAVLVRVAEIIRRGIRAYDIAARFGGDEFILMLPETTSVQADQVLVRVRQQVESADFLAGIARPTTPLSVSWGIACFPADGETPDALMRAADSRLYGMKKEK
jgi:diguanylate cyclase (GGDEF)-like protein